jgi:uncharacterized protein YcnI
MFKRTALLIAAFLAVAPSPITAHVRVFPDSNNVATPACGYAKFVMRVPVEKNIATNRIDLSIPKGVIVYGVQPKSGWTFALEKSRGVVATISWTGGRLMPGEFDEFAFLASAPKNPGPIYWDALQYYEDGSVVRWTGAPGAETPHSVTTVLPAQCPGKKPG